MTKVIPSEFKRIGRLDLASSRPIVASHWQTMAANLNLQFERAGALVGGWCFDPPFETTSDSDYSIENEASSGPDLDYLRPAARLTRHVESDDVLVDIHMFGAWIEVEIDIVIQSDGGESVYQTLTITRDGDSDHVSVDKIPIDSSDVVSQGTPELVGFKVNGAQRTDGSEEAKLWELYILESTNLDPSDLPTG